MFEQAFKNIDDVLWKEAGCSSELDYTEQSSWLLFLKYLDSFEQDKAIEAGLVGKKYSFILDKPYRWESWAAPQGKDGKLDHNTAKTGDDLHAFKQKASGPNTIEYKIGEIFGEIKTKIQSGYNLREIIDHIDELRFEMLRARLKPICHRTLRRQVTAYVPYTRRHAMIQEFAPGESEDRLCIAVSEYQQRENLILFSAFIVVRALAKIRPAHLWTAGNICTFVYKLWRREIISFAQKCPSCDTNGNRSSSRSTHRTRDNQVPPRDESRAFVRKTHQPRKAM